ncbi:hypothetical protein BME96_18995 (plasmid) [Virgibacillus halodenitrificans]|uniref:Uncharacterized protein n=1 Tax=Virgibacillus halodenitrificans TaxID=1482 RepID=A0AAC9J2R1_VIRHA|nr:hypothetical protein [Virgibacillus halodenitrificans]APC50371.1 hypothetical protein BME96_18995 [Virgibacillus halodenitrificans]
MIHELKVLYLSYKDETNQDRKDMIVDEFIKLCRDNPFFANPRGEDISYIFDFFQPIVQDRKSLKKNGTVLLINEEEFENMKSYFIENNYASSQPREMGWDVRFAEFKGAKDIILKNGSFHLMIFNDYEKRESTLITLTKIDDLHEQGRKEFIFDSAEDFCSMLSTYKKYLSKENGTLQAIDWIIKGNNFRGNIDGTKSKGS